MSVQTTPDPQVKSKRTWSEIFSEIVGSREQTSNAVRLLRWLTLLVLLALLILAAGVVALATFSPWAAGLLGGGSVVAGSGVLAGKKMRKQA